MIEGYFRQFEKLLAAAKFVHSTSITYDKRSASIGFLRGIVYFLDSSQLHLREFVNVEYGIERYMYAYHYQRADGTLVFRYDNTPHFPTLPTFPHHRHVESETDVTAVSPPDLEAILTEIQSLIEISMP